uniref:Helicase ATP-binding domain-containing protein n=2 Tax=Mesocestoides corti TaxID=53468 RepID=A0A5K3EF13_MESCO
MDLKIQGVPVHFPYKPYSCQLSMLNRVITALNNKQCCLLESPTGTGKTLALLCASLAWAEYQAGKCSGVADSNEVVHLKSCDLLSTTPHEQDEDFGSFIEDKIPDAEAVCTCGAVETQEGKKFGQVPRIIYATRTHKQISQVVREMRKTRYAGVKMCILSSRKHSCINLEVRKQANANDACQNLKGTCPYDQAKNRKLLMSSVQTLNQAGSWDLEDYVETLSKVPTCPYFFAFKLFERASICFCPYNYLLDPVFRETVSSDFAGSVVIIDEAHNIEDAARDATSVTLLEKDVLAASEDLKLYLNKANVEGTLAKDVTALINLLGAIHRVMQLTRSRLVQAGSLTSSAHVWSGAEIEGLLSAVGLGADRFEAVRLSFNRLNANIQKESVTDRDNLSRVDESQFPNSATLRLFTYIFIMLKFLYNDEMRRIQDYRAVLTEVSDIQRHHVLPTEDSNSAGKWLSRRTSAKVRLVESKTLSLNFWCLNPAVCMANIASTVHCLILASGTLSPLDAMAAELNLEFPVRLEASHVVPLDRVFAASVSRGPLGNRLCATYANQNVFTFQDDVGQLVLEACQQVPGGVLCFFPSYGLMDKLIARWELTGLLDKLELVKRVLREPRSSERFEDWVAEFYEAVDTTRGSPIKGLRGESVTGALALAVCRGKVSEGLDFTDDYGRLVIAIGIPFPAINNPQIEQKRSFNDTARVGQTAARCANPTLARLSNHASSRSPLKASLASQNCVAQEVAAASRVEWSNSPSKVPASPARPPPGARQLVLSGSEWYEAQAYRALNQALGRCIRHRNDWGAIILVDARFVEQPARYLSGISRWLRNQFRAHERWSDLSLDLADFVQRLTQITND